MQKKQGILNIVISYIHICTITAYGRKNISLNRLLGGENDVFSKLNSNQPLLLDNEQSFLEPFTFLNISLELPNFYITLNNSTLSVSNIWFKIYQKPNSEILHFIYLKKNSSLVIKDCNFAFQVSEIYLTIILALDAYSIVLNNITQYKINATKYPLLNISGLKILSISTTNLEIPPLSGLMKINDVTFIYIQNLTLTSDCVKQNITIDISGKVSEISLRNLKVSKIKLAEEDLISINLSSESIIVLSMITFSDCAFLGRPISIYNIFKFLAMINFTLKNCYIEESFLQIYSSSNTAFAQISFLTAIENKLSSLINASNFAFIRIHGLSLENSSTLLNTMLFNENLRQQGLVLLKNVSEVDMESIFIKRNIIQASVLVIEEASKYINIRNSQFIFSYFDITANHYNLFGSSLICLTSSKFSIIFNTLLGWNEIPTDSFFVLMKFSFLGNINMIKNSLIENSCPIINIEILDSFLLISQSYFTNNKAFMNLIYFSGNTLAISNSYFQSNAITNGSCIFNNPSVLISDKALFLLNSTFEYNNSTFSIINLREDLELSIILFKIIFNQNEGGNGLGGVIRVVRYNFRNFSGHIMQCLFKSNHGKTGGVITISTSVSYFLFEKCIFIKNWADASGGVFYFSGEKYSVFIFDSCYIAKNKATRTGGALNMPLGYFIDYNSVFENNYSEEATTIVAGSYGFLFMRNSLILSDGPGKRSVITAKGALTFELTGVLIVNSTSTFLLIFSRAKANISGCIFLNNRVMDGALFLVAHKADKIIEISKLAVLFNFGWLLFELKVTSLQIDDLLIKGSTPYILSSWMAYSIVVQRIVIYDLVLKNMELASLIDSNQDHSVILKYLFSDRLVVKATGTIFRFQNTKSVVLEFLTQTSIISDVSTSLLLSLNSQVYLSNSYASHLHPGYCIQSKESRIITNTIFFIGPRQSFTNMYQSFVAIYSSNSNITILNSFLQAMTASSVQVFGTTSQLIASNTIFLENIVLLKDRGGGGVFVIDAEVHIQNCIFERNQAVESNGGAIYLQSSMRSFWTLINNSFINNTAFYGGGALSWKGDFPPFVELGNIFKGNKADFGDDKASQAVRLVFEGGSILPLKPGAILNDDLKFFLIDYYGNRVSSGGRSRVWMGASDCLLGSEIKCDLNEEQNKEAFLMGETGVVSENGRIEFVKIRLLAKPQFDSILFIQTDMIKDYYYYLLTEANSGVINNYKTNENKYVFVLNLTFTDCSRGEIYSPTKRACESCHENFFSLNSTDTKCLPCLKKARCPGGDRIILDEGQWRSSANSTLIYQCLNIYSCKGGENPEDQCFEGYEGPLCGVCSKEISEKGERHEIYFMDVDRQCKKCDENLERRGIMIFIIVGLIIFGYLCFEIRDELINPASIRQVTLKVLTNHIQIMSIVLSANDRLPNDFQELFNVSINFSSPNHFFNTIECGLSNFLVEYNLIFKKVLIFTFLSLWIPIQILCFWLVLGLMRKRKFKGIFNRFLISYQITFFLTQPVFISEFAAILVCIKIDGTKYMRAFLAEKCWGEMHSKMAYYYCIPLLFFWFFLIPSLFFYFTRRNKKITKGTNVFSFITSGYKNTYYYWDFILMLKKMLFIIVVIAFNNTVFSFFANLFIVFINCISQVYFKPYRKNFLNNLSSISNIVLFLSVVCLSLNVGLINIKLIPFLVVIVPMFVLNIAFLIIWLKYYLVLYKPLMVFLSKYLGFKYYIDQFSGSLIRLDLVERSSKRIRSWNIQVDNYLLFEKSPGGNTLNNFSASNLEFK